MGCPYCLNYWREVKGTQKRVKKCSTCDVYLHRDSGSGLLMARLVKDMLNGTDRPVQFKR